jgi:hypothetical protein
MAYIIDVQPSSVVIINTYNKDIAKLSKDNNPFTGLSSIFPHI